MSQIQVFVEAIKKGIPATFPVEMQETQLLFLKKRLEQEITAKDVDDYVSRAISLGKEILEVEEDVDHYRNKIIALKEQAIEEKKQLQAKISKEFKEKVRVGKELPIHKLFEYLNTIEEISVIDAILCSISSRFVLNSNQSMCAEYFNESLYLSQQLLNRRYDRILRFDYCQHFLDISKNMFDNAIEVEQENIKRMFNKVNGFQCETEDKYQKLKLLVDELDFTLKSMPKISSNEAQLQFYGEIIDFICRQFISEILKLKDITEAESHRLFHLLDLEVLNFPFKARGRNDIHLFVPNYEKVQVLKQVMKWSLAEINEFFTMGALAEFSAEELVHLVKALFSDSEIRKRIIVEFQKQ